MQNNPEIEQIVDVAVKLARDCKHEYVMTEHVLLALIRHPPFRAVLEKFGTNVVRIGTGSRSLFGQPAWIGHKQRCATQKDQCPGTCV
jgi:ATP-dependent Clp protease ATP-binding subunit ClpA